MTKAILAEMKELSSGRSNEKSAHENAKERAKKLFESEDGAYKRFREDIENGLIDEQFGTLFLTAIRAMRRKLSEERTMTDDSVVDMWQQTMQLMDLDWQLIKKGGNIDQHMVERLKMAADPRTSIT